MDTDADRLTFARWILERNLGWIAASDVKTGVIVAIDTGMLAGLAAAFGAAHASGITPWGWLCSVLAAICLCLGVLCAALALFPRVAGPQSSFIFANCIIKNSSADYADAFRRAPIESFLSDCLDQIHRNAEIASAKFEWVRKAMGWSFVALLPWLGALASLITRVF